MRGSEITRKTNETDIRLYFSLDGGDVAIDTGCGFLDHMLTLFARHGGFGLTVTCKGDTNVDYHHTTEDVGIALGQAFGAALSDKRGICRYGDIILPMDEALVMTAVDVSGRAYLGFDVAFPAERVGGFDTELFEEFFAAVVREARITLHIRLLAGKNCHHIAEAAFKSFGRALKKAVSADPSSDGELPSTKGVL